MRCRSPIEWHHNTKAPVTVVTHRRFLVEYDEIEYAGLPVVSSRRFRELEISCMDPLSYPRRGEYSPLREVTTQLGAAVIPAPKRLIAQHQQVLPIDGTVRCAVGRSMFANFPDPAPDGCGQLVIGQRIHPVVHDAERGGLADEPFRRTRPGLAAEIHIHSFPVGRPPHQLPGGRLGQAKTTTGSPSVVVRMTRDVTRTRASGSTGAAEIGAGAPGLLKGIVYVAKDHR
jgi:hypothetical protein